MRPGADNHNVATLNRVVNTRQQDSSCPIARTVGVLGERWTLLIIREAISGTTRFAGFRDNLGLAPDLLIDRLSTLVEYGVMSKEPYREPGSRTRYSYHLTDKGRELSLVLAAIRQWGDKNLPWPEGPLFERRARRTNRPVHVAFIDDHGYEVPAADVALVPLSGSRSATEFLASTA